MPEYLSPGVYVEEIEIGPRPIAGVGTSTAGFLGMTERGPQKPGFVSSFEDFVRYYGSHTSDSYTAYAVEGFFANGGQRCFIGRVVKSGSAIATVAAPLPCSAVGPGVWGNRVKIRIEDPSSKSATCFKLVVAYWRNDTDMVVVDDPDAAKKQKNFQKMVDRASKIEVFDELSLDVSSADHYLKRVNGKSYLITIDETLPLLTAIPAKPADYDFGPALAGGVDSTTALTASDMIGSPDAQPGSRVGLTAFKEVDEIAILYAPDVNIMEDVQKAAMVDSLLSHCEALKDRFAVLDIPRGSADITGLSISSAPLRPSLYGAVYYPWIKVMDPLTQRQKLVPPGGYMAGIYARTDNERGVHKAPANALVRGALDVEFPITKGEQDLLNPRNINCIRFFQGQGILVWGGRTISDNTLWKYINVRRLFIYVEESIQKGTQWVVFEPNDERLWSRVIQTISQFLTGVWHDGALMGATPAEAFFIICDRTTMTQDDIDNGRLICKIGIAPVKPAEFVIFRIAQWQGGSAATE